MVLAQQRHKDRAPERPIVIGSLVGKS